MTFLNPYSLGASKPCKVCKACKDLLHTLYLEYLCIDKVNVELLKP